MAVTSAEIIAWVVLLLAILGFVWKVYTWRSAPRPRLCIEHELTQLSSGLRLRCSTDMRYVGARTPVLLGRVLNIGKVDFVVRSVTLELAHGIDAWTITVPPKRIDHQSRPVKPLEEREHILALDCIPDDERRGSAPRSWSPSTAVLVVQTSTNTKRKRGPELLNDVRQLLALDDRGVDQ